MHFRVEHRFAKISLPDYEQLYFDEPFNVALCRDVKLSRALVERSLNKGHLHRVLTVGPERELPRSVAKILGTDRIEYTEHLEYDWGRYRGTWKTVSSVMTEKVDCRGTFEFSESAGAILRLVEGEIGVKVFGIGGVIEKFIVADIEKSYEKASTFTQRWIDEGRPVAHV